MTCSTQNTADSGPARESIAPVSVSVDSPLSGNATVFVVEDDDKVRDILRLLIESAGMRVETYATADGFWETYDPQRPGCVLLDIYMPGMSGIELQQRLATVEPSRPIVFLTGRGNVPSALQAMRLGAVDYIEKPFQTQNLITRVRDAMERDLENRHAYVELLALEKRRAQLTEREREVMELMASGLTTKAIAARLEISPKTVDKHRAKILEKMDVDNSIELAHRLLDYAHHLRANRWAARIPRAR